MTIINYWLVLIVTAKNFLGIDVTKQELKNTLVNALEALECYQPINELEYE